MLSWIHTISQFTQEALFFEALAIFLLTTSYAAFWIIKKRRLGVIDKTIPASVVKLFLNDLILDANQLRSQLFGLLAEREGGSASRRGALGAGPALDVPSRPTGGGDNAELEKHVAELERIVSEQNQTIETLNSEKAGLAQAAKEGGGGGGSADPELLKKIQTLEEKLNEYSIIEDDLANLKKLQQENESLKKALAEKGGSVPEPTPEPATIDEAPTPEPEPEVAAAPEPAPAPEEVQELETQVEESIKSSGATAAGKESKKEEEKKDEKKPGGDGNDEDLLSEFEKMLNL